MLNVINARDRKEDQAILNRLIKGFCSFNAEFSLYDIMQPYFTADMTGFSVF